SFARIKQDANTALGWPNAIGVVSGIIITQKKLKVAHSTKTTRTQNHNKASRALPKVMCCKSVRIANIAAT
ncbi:MAG: hypothetical protein QX189_07445, partial [Methylococcales bacterium]